MEKDQLTDFRPWIELRYLTRQRLNGLDEFQNELQQIGSLHKRAIWSTAAGSDSDLWLVVKFGLELVASGIAYDLIKLSVKKLADALKRLYKKNENEQLWSLDLEYDDLTIRFYGIKHPDMSHIVKFMDDFPIHLDFLKSINIKNINTIEIVDFDIIGMPNEDELAMGKDWLFRYWKIFCEYGMDIVYYDSFEKKLLLDCQ